MYPIPAELRLVAAVSAMFAAPQGVATVAQAAAAPAAQPSTAASVPGVTPAPIAVPVPIRTVAPDVPILPRDLRSLVLPPAPALPSASPATSQLPPADLVGTGGPFVGITAGDAIAMGLSRNTDLAVSQSNRRIARYQIVQALGVYDLRFQLQPTFTFVDQAAQSAFQAGPNGTDLHTSTLGGNVGLAATTTTGATVRLLTSAERDSNDSTVNSFNPFYQTAIGINATQPLARGLAYDDNRRQIDLARINADLTTDTALLNASNNLSQVLDAYYNLVSAWKNVAIQEDALRQAKAQSESNARLVRRGQAAAVDVLESDTQVNVFQDNVYAAIQNVASLQNQLKGLILSDPADPIWTANLVPTTPVDAAPPEPALADVIVSALSRRPEVAQLREQIRNNETNLRYALDQTRPQIDLNVSASENGFAGIPQPPNENPFVPLLGGQANAINQLIARSNANNPGLPPLQPLPQTALSTIAPFQTGRLGKSYQSLIQGRYPQVNANVTLGFPIQNRTAKAAVAIVREQRRQSAINEVALVERVQTEARNAVQSYRSSRSRTIAAAAARLAAERVYASEIRKFRAGQSTTFLVLQREIDLANERGRELQAQTDLQRSLVEIDRVRGTILTSNNVNADTLGTAPLVRTPLSSILPQ